MVCKPYKILEILHKYIDEEDWEQRQKTNKILCHQIQLNRLSESTKVSITKHRSLQDELFDTKFNYAGKA